MGKKLPLFFVVGIVACTIDQATKYWARSNLTDNEPVQWLWDHVLGLRLAFNYGASFSFAENMTWVFSVFGVCAIIIIPFFLRQSKLWNICLALIWAGALGNLLDRLFSGAFGRGAVTDFIVYASWFTGNVADIFLCVGALGLLIILFKQSMAKESVASDE